MKNLNIINESNMTLKGATKTLNSVLTRKGYDKALSSTNQGMYLVTTESIRLWDIIQSNTAKRKPNWYKEMTLDTLGSALYLLASKVTLHDTAKIKWARHSVIEKIAAELFEGDMKLSLSFTEWLVDNSEMFTKATKMVEGKKVVTYALNPEISEEIIDKLNIQAAKAFYPAPMVRTPEDWEVENGITVKGGYDTKQYPLVRGVKDVSFITEDLLDTINTMQCTAYRVNKIALEAIKKDLTAPIKSEYITTPYSKENVIEYYRQHKLYESAVGKHRAQVLALNIAEQYQDEDRIYFPLNMDYRGRIYSIPVFLNPQGDEKVKAMLEFADGITLTEEGADNVYFTLAGLFGEDKKSRLERIEIGKTAIYSDYKEADEPYQFLALQTQMLAWEEDNNTLIYTPCHIDACCSGSQHTAALTGCLSTAQAVNIIPGEVRRDIYCEVADKAIILAKASNSEYKDYIIACLEDKGRVYAKRPTMVKIYGGKLKSFADYTYDTMKEFHDDKINCTLKCAFVFANILKDSLESILNGGTKFEAWIQGVSKEITKDNKGVTWTTPDGFKVVMDRKKKIVIEIKVCIDGRRSKLNLNTPTDNIDRAKNKSAISPNFVHSMDATHLRMTIAACIDKGIYNFNCIHDSLGVDMNNMCTLLEETKKAWIALYSDFSVGNDLRTQFQTQTDTELDKFPMLEGFDMNKVINSEYFFS